MRSEWGEAVSQYSRAASLDPSAARWLRVADCAAMMGSHAAAAQAIAAALRMQGSAADSALRLRLDRELHAAMLQ
jgi:hypothetical protein